MLRSSNNKARMVNYGRLLEAGITSDDALELQRIGRRLHRKDEDACNIGMNDEQAEKHGMSVAALERKAQKIAEKVGRVIYHQGDPRGCSLYLVSPEQLGGYRIEAVYDRGLSVYCW